MQWHGPPRSAVSSFQVCPHSRSSPITIHWSPFSITHHLDEIENPRLFIPTTFRSTILERLHEAHQGITRSKDRARLTVYWPGIDQDIEMYIADCKLCQDSLPSHPHEPIVTKPRLSRPFQQAKVAMDFAYYGGQYFLVVVDCLTDWPHFFPMGSDTTSAATIKVMRELFCCTAAPDVVWSDGGPQLTSGKFNAFLKEWGVQHEISSPTILKATERLSLPSNQ